MFLHLSRAAGPEEEENRREENGDGALIARHDMTVHNIPIFLNLPAVIVIL